MVWRKMTRGDKCTNIINTTGATTIVQLLLAFVRSGYISLTGGGVSNVGFYGYGWSRTAVSSTYAYNLYMNPIDVYPSYSSNRYNGFLLRCLYPGSA